MPNTEVQTNILKNYQFKFDIDMFPNVTYHVRDCQLPSVSTDQPVFATPHRDLILPGSKIIFDPLTITFLVDDDLKNYKEVYYWLLKIAFDKASFKSLRSDAVLHILNGDLTPKTSIKFINCAPNLLGD